MTAVLAAVVLGLVLESVLLPVRKRDVEMAGSAGAVSLLASAQPAAVVEGVQMPAWVERGGQRQPIVPGMVLQPGDVIQTGPGSRLLVRMSERSLVKLSLSALGLCAVLYLVFARLLGGNFPLGLLGALGA